MAKLGRFYEQPKIYIIILLFGLLVYILNINQRAGIVLFGLSTASGLIYLFYKAAGIKQVLLVNSRKANTIQAIIVALVALAITVSATIALGYLGGAFGISIDSIGSFIKLNKAATLGAEVSPFANNIYMNIAIFGFAFPIAETVLALQLFELILISFSIPVNFRDYRNWIVAGFVGIGAIVYHIYAKSTAAGVPNSNILLIMFFIFTTECLVAAYTRESESSIYHHIINNVMSLL